MSIDYNIGEKNKKIVIGHYHTSYRHVQKQYPNESAFRQRELEFAENANFSIYEDKNIIAIDGCTHYTKKINILVVDDEV